MVTLFPKVAIHIFSFVISCSNLLVCILKFLGLCSDFPLVVVCQQQDPNAMCTGQTACECSEMIPAYCHVYTKVDSIGSLRIQSPETSCVCMQCGWGPRSLSWLDVIATADKFAVTALNFQGQGWWHCYLHGGGWREDLGLKPGNHAAEF